MNLFERIEWPIGGPRRPNLGTQLACSKTVWVAFSCLSGG